MKKILLTVLIILITVPVIAQDSWVKIDPGDLTPEQVAELYRLKESADAARSGSPINNTPTVDQVEEWTTLGSKMGKAIAEMCSEMGVVVNEFLETPVGKVTAFVIVWKMIGSDIFGIFGGMIVWLLGTSILIFIYKRLHGKKIVSGPGFFVGLFTKNITREYTESYDWPDKEWEGISIILQGIAFALFTGVMLLIIF